MTIRFRAIKPDRFDPDAIMDAVRRAAVDVLEGIRKDFLRTTETWDPDTYYVKEGADNTIPTFVSGWGEEDGVIKAQSHTDHVLYYFLNQGTEVRYATMSRDFSAKTTPGYIGSNAGSGSKLFVDKNQPKPGIKARKWDVAIAHKHRPIAVRTWRNAVAEGVENSGHKYTGRRSG